MGTKPSEQFHSTLIAQYTEMVHEALLESNHLEFLDEGLFENKMRQIMVAAKLDGLTSEDIIQLRDQAKKETSFCKKAA